MRSQSLTSRGNADEPKETRSRSDVVQPRTSSGYPEPYRSRVLPREKRALGDPLGLTKIGINHTTLPPGKESSMRHWHTHEDEFIYVLSGEVVLRTDIGEQVLKAGMCAGFPASADGKTGDGHQLINRGKRASGLSGDQQPRQGGRGLLPGRRPALQRRRRRGDVLSQGRQQVLVQHAMRQHHGFAFERRRAPQRELLVHLRGHGGGDVAMVEPG